MTNNTLLKVFSVGLYEKFCNRAFGGPEEAIEHFLENVEAHGQVFSSCFEPDFYLNTYSDVESALIPPFYHYVMWGYKEFRVYSKTNFKDLLNDLESNNNFDLELYASSLGSDIKISPMEHAVLFGKEFRLFKDYDIEFVKKYYILNLQKVERHFQLPPKISVFNNTQVDMQSVDMITKNSAIDIEFYNRSISKKIYDYNSNIQFKSSVEAAKHYLLEGSENLLNPSSAFCTSTYLTKYSDILSAKINPLIHYLSHGKTEQRIAGGIGQCIQGNSLFDKNKETIVVISHEASKSGAPIVGLELCKSFSESFNVVSVIGKKGPLLQGFLDYSCECIVDPMQLDCHKITSAYIVQTYNPEVIICNSAETYPIAFELSNYDVKLISLIHEFSEYARPAGRLATLALLSDVTVVPAEIVKASLLRDAEFLGCDASKLDIKVRHQGAIFPKEESTQRGDGISHDLKLIMERKGKTKLVLGCGWVQPRKGVYKFFETARRVYSKLNDVLFVWVGANYDSYNDTQYCAFVDDFISKSGLNDCVHFIDHLEDLQPIWKNADCLLMSSLLDPFPNVAMDALVRAIPVVCFEGSTGIAELQSIYPELVGAAPFQDDVIAADLVVKFLSQSIQNKEKLLAQIENDFNYQGYCSYLLGLASGARAKIDKEQAFTLPHYLLKKLQFNHVYDAEEKGKMVNRVAPFFELAKTEACSNYFLSEARSNTALFVVIDFYGSRADVPELLAFVLNIKSLFDGNVKVYITVDSMSPVYTAIMEYELRYGLNLCGHRDIDQVIQNIVESYSMWNYEVIHVVCDKDYISTVKPLLIKSRYVDPDVEHIDGLELSQSSVLKTYLKSPVDGSRYRPLVKIYNNKYVMRLTS